MRKGIGPLRDEIDRVSWTPHPWWDEAPRCATFDPPESTVVRREAEMCGHHSAVRVYYSDGSSELESHAGDEGSDVPCGF
jgi:hypothetical protein